MSRATLSSRGRIAIPAAVRRKLGIETGDRIEFVEVRDKSFVIVPAIHDVRALRGTVTKPARPVSVDEMRHVVVRRAVR